MLTMAPTEEYRQVYCPPFWEAVGHQGGSGWRFLGAHVPQTCRSAAGRIVTPWCETSALLHVTSSRQANSCPGNALLSPMFAEEPAVSSSRDRPAWEKLVFGHLKSLSTHTRTLGWLDGARLNLQLTPSNQVSSRCSEMQSQH